MLKVRNRMLSWILTAVFLTEIFVPARADEETVSLTSPCAILMEASTGTVIYEKAADEERSPASITKIMTVILIFDALADGRISLEQEVTTSAYAKSMGGSQVFLEEGETQTVHTLLKCILIASGNDASVAMAEQISGSEEAFVAAMNERAKGLGMTHTHFEDCCGLTDSDDHYTSARDVAIMSRELITRYPQVREYSTVWMDTITHVTARGSSEFGLTNTNRLLKQYPWATGLKTGSTAKAKYCLSATADKDGVELIAVILGCPDYRQRFPEAAALLNYGYASCRLYRDEDPPALSELETPGGDREAVPLAYRSSFSWLSVNREDLSQIEKEIELEPLSLPLEMGQTVGRLVYRLKGTEIGSVDILAAGAARRANYFDYWARLWYNWLITDSARTDS